MLDNKPVIFDKQDFILFEVYVMLFMVLVVLKMAYVCVKVR